VGWAAGGFSEAARTAAGRKTFADSAARLVANHRADGLDVDWEYPGHHESGIASSPDDRANFILLLRAVPESLDRVEGAHGRLREGAASGRHHVSGTEPRPDDELLDAIWHALQ